MDFKGQTAALSAIFVLVGIIFLVPSISDKALAAIHATATGKCANPPPETGGSWEPFPCQFTLVGSHLDKGKWTSEPTQSGTSVTWSTVGNPQPGDEIGSVTYHVNTGPGRSEETVILSFDNPVVGSNKCGIKGVPGWCWEGSGYNAEFTYLLVGKGAERFFDQKLLNKLNQ